MTVAVTSRCRRRGVRLANVRSDATRLLRELQVDAELSVALVNDTEMQKLNAAYRFTSRPTDVLAFPLNADSVRKEQPNLLGDVVISLDTAARQAATQRIPVADEVLTLLVHGVLHLLGYEHETSAADAKSMFRKQRRLVARLRGGARARITPRHRRDPSRCR